VTEILSIPRRSAINPTILEQGEKWIDIFIKIELEGHYLED
jgi:hypothetical protein